MSNYFVQGVELKDKLEENETKTEDKQMEQPQAEKQGKPDNAMSDAIKELEKAIFAIKFYPVAVDKKTKNEAIEKLTKMYEKGNETIRQLMLFMIHENLTESLNLKMMHNSEYFRFKKPKAEAAEVRMSVYRAMFNYTTSIEGIIALIRFLGELKGSDDAAKLLTYHFSHLSFYENEATHIIRAAIVEALGKCDSKYALDALLEYARYTDTEKTYHRIVSALTEWEGKLDSVKMKKPEREELKAKLKEVVTREFTGSRSHYG